MVCAIKLARRGINVSILEKNNSVLKKVLISGNGKCNYFNSDMSVKHYRSNNIDILNNIISNNSNKVLDFFNSIGVVSRCNNGYYYPYSNTSTTIKNLLLVECKRLSIEIITDTFVKDIIKKDSFLIKTNNDDHICDKVIVATGSCAYIKDEYNGYKLLEKLGHSIIKPIPSLVMLEGSGNYFKEWAGIRCNACVKLFENDKYIEKSIGELQLTNYGISGICVMNLSGRALRILDNNKKASFKINFMPDIENGYDYFEKRYKMLPNLTLPQMLESIINYKLLYVILKKCHIDSNLTWNMLNSKQKKLLVDNIFNFNFDICGSKGFLSSQVVSGGVSLNEISSNFESKLVKGLYIIGELLDVDGDCGGYNLGFAWISGIVVGDNL